MPSLYNNCSECPVAIIDQSSCLTVDNFKALNSEVVGALLSVADLPDGRAARDSEVQAASEKCVTKIKLGECALFRLTERGFIFKKSK